ncbi:bifunctional N(6)-L-threonylcarbamoyladenine synthase/serine/threonine protein kinase [Candidatus Woesearchaeota archaeon]|nr:bifunctional N(6)-L-threonylcarbamoyladenine synthase/serine/threonine protein kinase [Candidatus Woesearchaeota archaeon]
MICLGIESTAHTLGVGIVDSLGNVLANVKDSYTTKKGGMIPVKAAEHHIEACDCVLAQALKSAGIGVRDIDVIAFSQGPGLGHTLRIGATIARTLSNALDRPLIGVNHCIAHLEIGSMLFPVKDPVLLYASGANTQVIAFDGGKYRIFGETLDIGVGNFIDCLARELGLGFPGGPGLYQLSLDAKEYIKLPYAVKGMDVSFGGLLTNLKQKISSRRYADADIAFSAQETVFSMLMEVSERALAHCGKDELLLGGGVSCNKRLQEMAKVMCKERGSRCYVPPNEFLVDNAAMIAWLGLKMHMASGATPISGSGIRPYERTDEVDIYWKID